LARDALVSAACRALGFVLPGRSPGGRHLPDRQDPEILIVKPASIGDVLLATPVLEVLRRSLPGARVTVAVGTWSRVAIENNPDVDELIDCGNVGTPGRYGPRAYLGLARALRRRHFDAAIVLDRSPLMALLPSLAGVKCRLGLDTGGRGLGLTLKAVPLPNRHEAEIYLDVVRAAGLSTGDARARFYPTMRDLAYARRLLEEWNPGGGRVIVVAPGGGTNPGTVRLAKRWSAAGFAMAADRLAAELDAAVVLIGQEADEESVRAVQSAMTAEPINLLGQTSFGQLGGLLQHAAGFLGNDSAPGHLSAAVGIPTVAVFTDTDPDRFRPFAPRAVGIRATGLTETTDRILAALRPGEPLPPAAPTPPAGDIRPG
jgi:ADP-heptose:LPS heptosyltransferase